MPPLKVVEDLDVFKQACSLLIPRVSEVHHPALTGVDLRDQHKRQGRKMMRRFAVIVWSALLSLATFVVDAAAEPMQLAVNAQMRTFLVERPPAPGPHPTIIMLHGAAGGAAREVQLSQLAQLGPGAGFVAVFPEGRGGRWNFFPPGRETAQDLQFFESQGGVPDDVAFLKALVGDLVRRGISDPKRVYIAGRSLGGVMALRMVCVDAELFAAVGLLISAMPDATGADCRPAKRLPVLMINATADQILPYAGGRSVRGDELWSTERLVGFFRSLNGCTQAVEASVLPSRQPQTIEFERWSGCSPGPVAFYRIVGGGHEVPPTLNATGLLLDFFRDKTSDGVQAARAGGSLSIKQLFEKHDLLGKFALDCTKPAGGGNLYIIHHALAPDRVQRQQMSGPETRDYSYVIDRASETPSDEITFSMANQERRFNLVARIDRNRMRTMESAPETGPKVITGGRFTNGGSETPWFNKCL